MRDAAIDNDTGERMVRVHLWLFERDLERLDLLFKDSYGRSRAARTMIRKYLDNLEAINAEKVRARAPDVELSDVSD